MITCISGVNLCYKAGCYWRPSPVILVMAEYATGELCCLFFYSIHLQLPNILSWLWQQVTENLMTALQKHNANHFTKKSCLLKSIVRLSTNHENQRISVNWPNHRMDSSTSNAYFMSPSTSPGVSTNVTKLNFFCFDVEISVVK